ncbi:MerR family transcriptional regulator [Paenibacillus turpanensis]|uniref:MerR family transcriptional regulator n=1 Tax=Paenibacillus turpanensis TaxID=2689078 RepID=UPI00140D6E03|nr:MerR family transcriptional regulator [Paenibacillus turpanensis]
MKLYKIGELASMLGVSSRTIDYYTKLGLIHPEKRSNTNYRLYSDETLARLKRIEWMKQEKYTLEEIKESLEHWGKTIRSEEVSEKLTAIQLHMKQLEREIKEISPMLEQLKPNQAKHVLKALTPSSAACIESLLLLLSKGPLL